MQGYKQFYKTLYEAYKYEIVQITKLACTVKQSKTKRKGYDSKEKENNIKVISATNFIINVVICIDLFVIA